MKTEQRILEWFPGVAEPGETLRSWATLGYPNPDRRSRRVKPLDDRIAELGLVPDEMACQGHAQLVAVISDRRLLLAGVGGFRAVKPKDVVLSAPMESVRVEWEDRTEVGPDRRVLLFLLGDSWVRHQAMVKDDTNIVDFIDALAHRAVCVG